jgi:hypothetical protein
MERSALPRRRRNKVDLLEDNLPEHVHYQDSGCEVSPTCLECPLPVCRYEVPGGLSAILREPRDAEVLTARRQGTAIDGICRQFGLSRRTVFRILSAARRAQNHAGKASRSTGSEPV